MWMIFTEHFTHDTGRLLVSRIRADAHVVHSVQNASLHGLESVTRIGQGARHDHAHRIIEIRLLHFLVNVYLSNDTKFHKTSFFAPLSTRSSPRKKPLTFFAFFALFAVNGRCSEFMF